MKKIKGFTLAEVLITLAIIGVVAALTIPSVISSYKDKQYNTARLKALKTFGEAGKLASINDEMNSQSNATDFVNKVLSKYLKITKVCTLANSEDCGFPIEIQPLNTTTSKLKTIDLEQWNQIGYNNTNSKISSPKSTKNMSRVVSTADGFSALIHYNPKCGRTNHEITHDNPCEYKECNYYNLDATCMNVIYDMNGLRSPNHVGEDIGIVTVYWSGLKTTAVAPGIAPSSVNSSYIGASFAEALNACVNKGTKKIQYAIPNIDEISSLHINKELTSLPGNYFWSGSSVADRPGISWSMGNNGSRYHSNQSDNLRVWCIRR